MTKKFFQLILIFDTENTSVGARSLFRHCSRHLTYFNSYNSQKKGKEVGSFKISIM